MIFGRWDPESVASLSFGELIVLEFQSSTIFENNRAQATYICLSNIVLQRQILHIQIHVCIFVDTQIQTNIS